MRCACCGAISLEPVPLTVRESDVLVQLCKGFTIAEIGERLGMSRFTTNDHIKVLYGKLGVGSRAEAAVVACRMGMAV